MNTSATVPRSSETASEAGLRAVLSRGQIFMVGPEFLEDTLFEIECLLGSSRDNLTVKLHLSGPNGQPHSELRFREIPNPTPLLGLVLETVKTIAKNTSFTFVRCRESFDLDCIVEPLYIRRYRVNAGMILPYCEA